MLPTAIARLVLPGIAATLLLTGCETAPKVGTDFNPQYDFAGHARLAVMRPDVAQGQGGNAVAVPNELVAQRLSMAIEGALIARGYQVVPPEQAQMIVTFFVTTQNQVDVRTYNAGFGYGACWSPYRCAAWANPQQVDVVNYKEGTLYIDFIDKATRKLQWRGVTSDRLPSTPSREKRDQIVRKAVDAILAQYPPGAAAP